MHIITHPLTIAEEISILFTIIRKKILTQVSIKARGAILTTSRIILGFFVFCPAGTHITTVNQFGGKFLAVIMSGENATQPFGIRVPMMIYRKYRTVLEFDSNSGASCHEAFR